MDTDIKVGDLVKFKCVNGRKVACQVDDILTAEFGHTQWYDLRVTATKDPTYGRNTIIRSTPNWIVR